MKVCKMCVKAALVAAAAVAVAFLGMGCEASIKPITPGGDDDTPITPPGGEGSGVSFESFSPRSILVENGTNRRLVAFKGSVTPGNLISGIPEFATNHGLKKEGIFDRTGDFALVLVSEEEYIKNKSNPASAPVFAEIYAFYNHEADNNNVFKISGKAGGAGRIILNNPTPWNIEIRADGPTGEVLGYVASQMTNTALRLEIPGDYNLFPVFKRYNPTDKEIYEVVPKYAVGNELLIGKPFMQSFALGEEPQTWNFNELASNLNFAISSGGFYIRIENSSGVAIRFARGTTEVATSTGTYGIRQTYTNVYNIRVTRNPDGSYPESQVVAGYSVGTVQLMLPLPEREYKTDYVYTVRITGTTAATLEVGEIVESDEPMDLEAKFNQY